VLSHWRALTHYIDDGLLEIDNSSAERPLRAVAIGRLLAALEATRIRLAAPTFRQTQAGGRGMVITTTRRYGT